MASESLPGKSVRPQPSRNNVSPETSRPSTRKHWMPGVWPGVCTSSMRTSPTVTTSPGSCTARSPTPSSDLHDVGRFGLLHVDLHADELEQLPHALDPVAHHRAADVIGVVVGGQR